MAAGDREEPGLGGEDYCNRLSDTHQTLQKQVQSYFKVAYFKVMLRDFKINHRVLGNLLSCSSRVGTTPVLTWKENEIPEISLISRENSSPPLSLMIWKQTIHRLLATSGPHSTCFEFSFLSY